MLITHAVHVCVCVCEMYHVYILFLWSYVHILYTGDDLNSACSPLLVKFYPTEMTVIIIHYVNDNKNDGLFSFVK